MTNVVSVFTYRSVETILAEGGTQAWRCVPARAHACEYVIIARNQNGVPPKDGHPGIAAEGSEAHRTAFMIGRLHDVCHVDDTPTGPRYLFQISHWAPLNIPEFWQKWRAPVKYMTLEETGIDVDALDWKVVPQLPSAINTDTDTATETNRLMDQMVERAFPAPDRLKVDLQTTVPLVLPAVRSIEDIVNELKRAIAAQRETAIENVDLKVTVRQTTELTF